jgi:hypothetical protein
MSVPQGCATPGELSVLQLRARLSGKNWFPVVWQKLSNAVNRMGGNSRKHVFEPGEGFHAHPLTGCREASQDGCSLATPVTAEEIQLFGLWIYFDSRNWTTKPLSRYLSGQDLLTLPTKGSLTSLHFL